MRRKYEMLDGPDSLVYNNNLHCKKLISDIQKHQMEDKFTQIIQN